MLIIVILTMSCADPGIIYSYLPIEIAIGFSTGSRSLKSDETNGTVTVSVQVFNGTIQEGATVSIRFTTADDSAYGRSIILKLMVN